MFETAERRLREERQNWIDRGFYSPDRFSDWCCGYVAALIDAQAITADEQSQLRDCIVNLNQ